MDKQFGKSIRSRNSDCRITSGIFFGELPAVVLENNFIRMTVLAGRGADVVEFLYKPLDIDLVWLSSTGIPSTLVSDNDLTDDEVFLKGYPGGWQSIFPNGGAPSTVKGIKFGQHDEVALLPWKIKVIKDTSDECEVQFAVQTRKTPFKISKTFLLKKQHLVCQITEVVENMSEDEWQVMWGTHFSFGAPFIETNSQIKLPNGCAVIPHPIAISSSGRRVGSTEVFTWPLGKSKQGAIVDFSKLPVPGTKSEMLYVTELNEGWYEINNLEKKIGARVCWDLDIMPYLWFWQEFGESATYPWFGNHYNIGLEPFSSFPTTGLADAISNGSALKFKPKEIKTSKITYEVINL